MVIKSILTAMLALMLVSCTGLGDYFENYANSIKGDIEFQVRNKENIDRSLPYTEKGAFKTKKKQSIDSNRDKWLFETEQGCKVEYITDKKGVVLSGKITSSNKSCEDSKIICWHCS